MPIFFQDEKKPSSREDSGLTEEDLRANHLSHIAPIKAPTSPLQDPSTLSRLERIAYESRLELLKVCGEIGEKHTTIAVGQTKNGTLVFTSNEDSAKMRTLLESLAKKFGGHALFRKDVELFAKLNGVVDPFAEYRDAEWQLALMSLIWKQMKILDAAATKLICEKCANVMKLAGIEPATLLKSAAQQNLRELRQLDRAARLEAKLAEQRANELLARVTAVPPNRGAAPGGFKGVRGMPSPKAVGWVLIVIEVLKLGFQAYESIRDTYFPEKGEPDGLADLARQMDELKKSVEAKGFVIVPVLRACRTPPAAIEPRWDDLTQLEKNARIFEQFEAQVRWEYRCVPKEDYAERASLALSTRCAAYQAYEVIFPSKREHLAFPGTVERGAFGKDTTIAEGLWKQFLDGYHNRLVRIYEEAGKEHFELTRKALEKQRTIQTGATKK